MPIARRTTQPEELRSRVFESKIATLNCVFAKRLKKELLDESMRLEESGDEFTNDTVRIHKRHFTISHSKRLPQDSSELSHGIDENKNLLRAARSLFQ